MTMHEYEFTLRFVLPSSDIDLDALSEALYGQGCDDALIGVGQPGRLGLDFVRVADTAVGAVLSAIADVRTAVPEADLIEVTPDLVGVSDVAALFGRTRQNMYKLILNSRPSAPAPVH